MAPWRRRPLHFGNTALFLVSDLQISETVYGSLMAINTVMIIFLEVPLTLAIEGWPHRRALSIGALLFAIIS